MLSRPIVKNLSLSRTRASQVISVVDSVNQDENVVPYSEVPGPKPLPLLGNSWRFLPYIGNYKIENVDQVSQRLYRQYGDVVKISGILGRPDMIFLFNPNDIEKIFRQEDTMPYRPSMPSLNYYKHVYKKEFFGENAGVIAVHGENWHNFRTKVQQVLLQPKIAKLYIKPIEDTAVAFINRIEEIKNRDHEVPQDFLNEIHKWSLESIARVALDVRLGCLDPDPNPDTQRLIDAVNTFFINVPVLELKIPFWKVFPTPTWKQFIKALDSITEICTKHINEALKSGKEDNKAEPSVLQRILAMDNNTKMATVLALDLFLVGIDTTSNAVASILYQLALHPDKQELLYQEISNVLSDTNITTNTLNDLVYLKAVIKETLRMYPVVISNGRCITRDCIIGGYQIPEGVQVIFSHFVISNMDKYFTKSREFIPERWLKSCPHNSLTDQQKHHNFASLPFGYGRRMCLGRRFADLELQTIIAKVIQKYKIEYHHERLQYHVHPMYTPNGPLKLRFLSRN